MLGLSCAFLNSGYILLWGQRSLVVVVMALLLLGSLPHISQRQRQRPWRARAIGVTLLAAGIVAVVSLGLRVWRDTVTRGQVYDVVAEGTATRQISLATNSMSFDRAMLAFRDWPARYDFRGGEDFINGTLGVIPRFLWPEAPTGKTGAWFRQVYQPGVDNGWPPGAPVEWYLNFGLLGLVIGGLFAGLVFGFLSREQRKAGPSALNTAIALIAAVYVFQLGLPSDTISRIVFWLIPLAAVTAFLRHSSTGAGPVA